MLTFEQYRDAGGEGTLEEFGERMAFVWLIIDDVVMHRWDEIPEPQANAARIIAARMLDDYDAIKEEEEGGTLTSFSNGVASYGFSGGSSTQTRTGVEAHYIDALVRLLPVGIVSRALR